MVSQTASAEVTARAPAPLVGWVQDWVRRQVPLPPLRAYPLSLYTFLGPGLRDNPCYAALTTVELLDADGFTAAAHALLYDPERRAAQRAKQRLIVHEIRQLPAGQARYRSLLP